MKKRLLGVTLCTAVLAFGLTACSSPQINEKSDQPNQGSVSKGVKKETAQQKQKEALEDLAILTPVTKFLHALKMEDADGIVATYDNSAQKKLMKQQYQRFFQLYNIHYQVVSQSIVSKTFKDGKYVQATVKVVLKSIASKSEQKGMFQDNQTTQTYQLVYQNKQWEIHTMTESDVHPLDANGNVTNSNIVGN